MSAHYTVVGVMASAPLADDVIEELETTGLQPGDVDAVAHVPPADPSAEAREPAEIKRLLMEAGLPQHRARRFASQCTHGAVVLIVRTAELTSRRVAEVVFAKYGAEATLLRAS